MRGERCDSLKFEKRQLVCVRRPKKRGRKEGRNEKAVNKEVLPPLRAILKGRPH